MSEAEVVLSQYSQGVVRAPADCIARDSLPEQRRFHAVKFQQHEAKLDSECMRKAALSDSRQSGYDNERFTQSLSPPTSSALTPDLSSQSIETR